MLSGCATTMPMSDIQQMSESEVGALTSTPALEKPVGVSQKEKQPDNSPKPLGWVLGREHKHYAHARYLVGVGFSKENTVSASESARAEIAKNIRFKIASVMKDYISNDGSFVESFIQIETDALLEGVEIVDGWYDAERKVYYSFAVVKRKTVLATVQAQIDEVASNASLTMEQADEFLKNGDVLKSLVYYYDGFNESSKLLPYIRTYKSVSLFPELPPISSNIPSTIDFKEKVQAIVGNIEVEKVKSSKYINGEVSFAVVISYYGKPLRNLPIKFHGNSYRFISRVLSDERGWCEVKTTSSKILNDKNFAVVKAEVDLFALAKRFNYKLKKDLFGRLDTLDVTFKKFREYDFQFYLDKEQVKIGEQVVFFVKSDVSGFLTIHSQKVVDDTPSKVFPNKFLKDNYIQKNKVYNIGGVGYPFHFQIKGPVSQEVVKAVLYKDEDLTEVLSKRTFNYEVVKGD